MKAKISTLAALLFLSIGIAEANTNSRTLRMILQNNQEIIILQKEETLIETELDEKGYIFSEEVQQNEKNEWIDIRPFVKPEKEIEEEF